MRPYKPEKQRQKDYFDTIGESFCDIYRTHGMESSLFFLRTALSRKIAISQINAIGMTPDMRELIPVCSTNPGCSVHREVNPQGRRPRYICPESPVNEVFIENNLTPYKNEFTQSFSERGTCFVGQRALLRIPFYVKDEQIYLMQFWSQAVRAFSPRAANAITRVLDPFRALLGVEGFDFHEKNKSMRTQSATTSGYEHLCRCNALSDVLKQITRVAQTGVTVLITGETGVGKEYVADAVHELSGRRNSPIIKVNCGAISESLIDSELFGHEKGSFTGAINTHPGYFEQANTGTLFLDEIGELPLSAQVKLLRVLDSHTFQRVGSSKIQSVDIRLIAATNRNLMDMVKQGTFRKDLYYRISVYPLFIPPLKERKEDILPLTDYFINKSAKEMDKHITQSISAKDIESFYSYSWPGNIRELKNVVDRAIINCVSGMEISRLSFEIEPKNHLEETCAAFCPPSGWPTLCELEQSYICAVMERCNGKMTGAESASRTLGIHYTTLRTHLRRMSKDSSEHKILNKNG